MINTQDAIRLANLYTSQPMDEEQAIRKDKLISELELKLGIRKPDDSVLVEHGDTSDMGTMFKGKR
jgi:hypothetical protein